MEQIPVYIFACDRVGNIENGLRAKLWAVNEWDNNRNSLASRALAMPVGSFGLLYSSSSSVRRAQEHTFRAAFRTTSIVDITREVRDDIWDGTWIMPFAIEPLTGCGNQFTLEDAKSELAMFRQSPDLNTNDLLRISPITVFVPTMMPKRDWELILCRLSN